MTQFNMDPIKVLVDFYKERGVSCEKILQDPVFSRLTLAQQIDALHQHADEIQSGIHTAKPATTILKSMLKGVLGGAAMSVPAMLLGHGRKLGHPLLNSVALSGIVGGAAVGTAAGIATARGETKHKASVNKYLSQLHKDPSAAIKLLSENKPLKTSAVPFTTLEKRLPAINAGINMFFPHQT